MERTVSGNMGSNKEVKEMVKDITVLSGKGGTGKTCLTASLAVLTKNSVLADCDVDAPDLHMLLNPEVLETQEFKELARQILADLDRKQ